jgi:putative transposase
MPNTFSCLNMHFVFSTKECAAVLGPPVRERLFPYMGGIAKQNGLHPKCIGGVADHVHLLLGLPPSVAPARAIQLIKGGSSAWIHQSFPELRNFGWQEGYGAFSVGISQVPDTINYIQQQVEHHRTRTFQEEYLSILREHHMSFDEKYVWG